MVCIIYATDLVVRRPVYRVLFGKNFAMTYLCNAGTTFSMLLT